MFEAPRHIQMIFALACTGAAEQNRGPSSPPMIIPSAFSRVFPEVLAQSPAGTDTGRIILWIAVIVLILLCGFLGSVIYRSKRGPKPTPSADELRGRLAQVVTMWAMAVIVILGILMLLITGYHAMIANDKDARAQFIETGKYIFAAIVPVVAAWVGTVMAFYFGKENFKAATDSMSQIARQFTSQDKLGQTQVEQIGKAIGDVAPLQLEASDTPETITLDTLSGKMTAKAPPFERLPVLKSDGTPLMVVHRSILNDFLLTKKEAEPDKKTADFKLSDLVAAYSWLTEDSFVTVGPVASAADAKTKMAQHKGCADVFVTQDGTSATPVTRWITNVDLLQAAQV
jgi:heme/copper-type cytochrome/quinol oxidase subunit 2